MSFPQSFTLLDGTAMPTIAWGNGSGDAAETAIVSGEIALRAGLRHIDTAQMYKNEKQTGQAITNAGVSKADVYVCTKLSKVGSMMMIASPDEKPLPLSEVRSSVQETIARLGFQPNVLLLHDPFVPEPGKLIKFWQVLEDMKDKGELTASLGVSNFRPQDLEAILKVCKYKPVVNQLEYHPFVLSHLQPVLDIHAAHGIRTVAYGLLGPILRHPSRGGPLRPIISRIAARISVEYGKPIGEAEVLLLWTVGTGAVAVSASGNPKNINALAEVYSGKVPTLTKEEIEEITEVGKKIHWRNYRIHMEVDSPLPNLPEDI